MKKLIFIFILSFVFSVCCVSLATAEPEFDDMDSFITALDTHWKTNSSLTKSEFVNIQHQVFGNKSVPVTSGDVTIFRQMAKDDVLASIVNRDNLYDIETLEVIEKIIVVLQANAHRHSYPDQLDRVLNSLYLAREYVTNRVILQSARDAGRDGIRYSQSDYDGWVAGSDGHELRDFSEGFLITVYSQLYKSYCVEDKTCDPAYNGHVMEKGSQWAVGIKIVNEKETHLDACCDEWAAVITAEEDPEYGPPAE